MVWRRGAGGAPYLTAEIDNVVARLVLITGLAPSVIERQDYAILHRVMELYVSDMDAMQGKTEDAEFARWKRDMGFS